MRLRKKPLPVAAVGLMLFFAIVVMTLIYELAVMLTSPFGFDWLTVLMLGATLLVFGLMLVGVGLFDLQAQMTLNRQGIYIEPALFKAFTVPWEDIATLSLQNRQGMSLIEYQLKPGSGSFEAQPRKHSRTAQRSGGFHGWLPVQSYQMEVNSPHEQYEVKVNRLFPMLRRYWLKSPGPRRTTGSSRQPAVISFQ